MNIADLEERIRILEDLEAVKKLKARYWYCVDAQRWEELAECYTEDAVFSSPFFGTMERRDYIIKVLKRSMRGVKTSHQGHNPDIEIIDSTRARGRWSLNDRVEMNGNRYLTGYGLYEDEYVKENGNWKIKKTILTYIFQEKSGEA